jgi:hypothetical protein
MLFFALLSNPINYPNRSQEELVSKPFNPTDRPGKKSIWLQSMVTRVMVWQHIMRQQVLAVERAQQQRITLWVRRRSTFSKKDRRG